ncbi:NAD(P)-dependent oxidoreductase, partial [Paenibacillus sp. TAF58]
MATIPTLRMEPLKVNVSVLLGQAISLLVMQVLSACLGRDVAAWDPFATEPSFHRAGARKEWHLSQLIQDAEIFVPMVPLTEKTSGLITSEHIHSLPKG